MGQDLGFIVILIAAAWGAGAAVRRLTGRSAALETRARVLSEQARTAAAQERERLARELHDVVSHSVSLMVVQAGAAEQVLRSDPDQAERALRAVQTAGRSAVDDLRRMLGLLRDSSPPQDLRSPQPSLADLDVLVAAQGAAVEVDCDQYPPLPPGVDLAAYRIVQEALTNARKHAPGQPTSVRVGWAAGQLSLDIRNRAVEGGRATAEGTGHGLIGMRERAALYGGTLQAGPDHNEWVVHATLPVMAR